VERIDSIPCPTLRVKEFSLSSLSMILLQDVIDAPAPVESIISDSSFSERFYYKWLFDFVKCFL
jgi:hypothetical protein